MVLGITLSALGALVGSTAWFFIVKFTGYELGLIAWAVGGLAGIGMYAGYRGTVSVSTGLIAAVVAVVAILAAKLAIFGFLIYAVLTGDTSDIDVQRQFVTIRMAHEALDEQAVLEKPTDEQWESAYAEANDEVAGMPEEQVVERWQTYREADELYVAASDPRVQSLGFYESNRRAQREGLSYEDERRETYYDQALSKFSKMSDEALDTATVQFDSWQAEGKWLDGEYVTDFLIYYHIDQAWEQRISSPSDDTEQRVPTTSEWQEMYTTASDEINVLAPDEQLARARKIEHEQEQQIKWRRLAYHRADRRGDQLGLSYVDTARDQLYDEELAASAKLPEQDVDAAISDLESWQVEGKWSDHEYVREFLIYHRIDQNLEDRPIDEDEEEVDDDAEAEGWKRQYEDAAAHVDAMSQSDRMQEARRIEAENDRRIQEMMAQFNDVSAEDVMDDGGGFLKIFTTSMFGLMDLVFLGLAVVTAFRIGGQGLSTE